MCRGERGEGGDCFVEVGFGALREEGWWGVSVGEWGGERGWGVLGWRGGHGWFVGFAVGVGVRAGINAVCCAGWLLLSSSLLVCRGRLGGWTMVIFCYSAGFFDRLILTALVR